MMARLSALWNRSIALFDWLFADDGARRHEPELSIALRQAMLLVGPAAIVLGIGIMAILP